MDSLNLEENAILSEFNEEVNKINNNKINSYDNESNHEIDNQQFVNLNVSPKNNNLESFKNNIIVNATLQNNDIESKEEYPMDSLLRDNDNFVYDDTSNKHESNSISKNNNWENNIEHQDYDLRDTKVGVDKYNLNSNEKKLEKIPTTSKSKVMTFEKYNRALSSMKHHLYKLQLQLRNYEFRPSLNKLKNILYRCRRAKKWILNEYNESEEFVDVVEQVYWLLDSVERDERQNIKFLQSQENVVLETTETFPLLENISSTQSYLTKQSDIDIRIQTLKDIQDEKIIIREWVEEAYNKIGKIFETNDVLHTDPNSGWIQPIVKYKTFKPHQFIIIGIILMCLLISLISFIFLMIFSFAISLKKM